MGNRKLALLALVASACLCATGPALARKMSTGDAATDEAIVGIQQKLKALKGCRVTITTTLKMEGQEFQVVDRGAFLPPGKFRLDRVIAGQMRQTVVSDGGLLWVHDETENMVTRVNLARVFKATGREADGDQPDPTRPFRALQWDTIRLAGADGSQRASVLTFEAAPLPSLLMADMPSRPARTRLLVDAEDGLLRQVLVLDASGQAMVSYTFGEVAPDAAMEESLFEFVVPAGAHVMDTTDDTILSLKALGEPPGP